MPRAETPYFALRLSGNVSLLIGNASFYKCGALKRFFECRALKHKNKNMGEGIQLLDFCLRRSHSPALFGGRRFGSPREVSARDQAFCFL